MTDDHHDNRYEDGEAVHDPIEYWRDHPDSHPEWTTWEMVTTIARHLRPGDVIVHNGRRLKITAVDNVDGFIEIVGTDRTVMARWSRQFVVTRKKVSSTEQP